MATSAWLRRFVVSIGIAGVSYAIMLGIMVLRLSTIGSSSPSSPSPSIRGAAPSVRSTPGVRKPLGPGGEPPAGTGEHDGRRVVIIAAIVIGIPFNYVLGGTRTALQRIALISVPATVVLAVGLFTFNALVPERMRASCGSPIGFSRRR